MSAKAAISIKPVGIWPMAQTICGYGIHYVSNWKARLEVTSLLSAIYAQLLELLTLINFT